MNSKNIICFACGASVPNIHGPTHAYMLSAPGCWKLFGDILAKEYVKENYDPDPHRITVDTYAVTHPGNSDERRSVQSVNIHLIRLYYVFEKNMRGEGLLETMRKISKDQDLHKEFVWLTPPMFDSTLHLDCVLTAKDFEGHKRLVKAWGQSVWTVWKNAHGAYVESLAKKVKIDF